MNSREDSTKVFWLRAKKTKKKRNRFLYNYQERFSIRFKKKNLGLKSKNFNFWMLKKMIKISKFYLWFKSKKLFSL